MKEYKEKVPVLAIGGRTGSFLGEYCMAASSSKFGIGSEDRQPVGTCGTVRTAHLFICAPRTCRRIVDRSWAHKATEEDMQIAAPLIQNLRESLVQMPKVFCADEDMLRPNTQNPYKQPAM